MTANDVDVTFGGWAHRSSHDRREKRFTQTKSLFLAPWWHGLYMTALCVHTRPECKRKRRVCLWVRVSVLTFAGAFVRLQLHEVRASTGEGLIEVDETEVGARAFTITGGTWVRSWKKEKVMEEMWWKRERHKKTERIRYVRDTQREEAFPFRLTICPADCCVYIFKKRP